MDNVFFLEYLGDMLNIVVVVVAGVVGVVVAGVMVPGVVVIGVIDSHPIAGV